MDKFPITVNGQKKLRDELDFLTNVERPKIIDSISVAREHGDLKENAEYHAAREQQSFVEGRIKDIKLKLSNAEIVDPKKITSSKVVFSATVILFDFDNEKEITYSIVGDDEADIKKSMISINSPIARALIGKEENDVASVETPSGKKEFEILNISYE
ncbi:MAG: transcription elongation factor GreA [Gammaproteobacteria bacterium]|jgi:transcription elongation factor GreA|nr:transcription elongation factor GreA [Gammaproteobacteria bacterium]|tara:strand:+ start:641 stop:1114 length:474 start_codon:yes stop_codon:yes gene_type:complete